jgi:long-subunit acyl-CoA synthetase (AMP-forming)
MELSKITGRLSSFKDRGITYYDGEGQAVRKTYPEVHADVQQAVERLRAWGVRPGTRVGILATNCYEWAVYDLALLDLRCPSFAFPEEFGGRTSRELVEKYQLALLLLRSRDSWPVTMAGEWATYMDAGDPREFRARPLPAHEDGDDGEFVPSYTFSSGTSGKIKCLITSRRGAEETIASFRETFDIGGDDSFLVFLPLSSFQQRLMIYAGFFYGFDLLLVNPSQVFAAFRELRPTLCLAPPLLYETIHAQFDKAVRNLGTTRRTMLKVFGGLAGVVPLRPVRDKLLGLCYGKIYAGLGGRIRIMWTGMAPIKSSTLDFFARARVPVYEAYGLTECGAITSNTPAHHRRGSVGRPLVAGGVYLADDGEIFVRQQHLQTTGYLECDPGEEARTYVAPNTVATGDIGYFDRDGFLYLVGRKKEFIITGQGHKAHPETLEAELERCPGVERAVVFGNDLPYLHALVSIGDAGDDAAARVRKHLEKINAGLPPAARVVRHFVTTEQFTRENGLMTRNLKLDRRAIFRRFEHELLGASVAAATTGVAEPPEIETATGRPGGSRLGELESEIAAVWRDVLKVERVGRNDNFFELGGNSLLLAEAHGRLQTATGKDLTLVELFDRPTIAALAAHLAALESERGIEEQGEPSLRQHAADRAEKQRAALSRQRQFSRERGKVS